MSDLQPETEREIAKTETWRRAATDGDMLLEGCPVQFDGGRQFGVAWCSPDQPTMILHSGGIDFWPDDCAPRLSHGATEGALLSVLRRAMGKPRMILHYNELLQKWGFAWNHGWGAPSAGVEAEVSKLLADSPGEAFAGAFKLVDHWSRDVRREP